MDRRERLEERESVAVEVQDGGAVGGVLHRAARSQSGVEGPGGPWREGAWVRMFVRRQERTRRCSTAKMPARVERRKSRAMGMVVLLLYSYSHVPTSFLIVSVFVFGRVYVLLLAPSPHLFSQPSRRITISLHAARRTTPAALFVHTVCRPPRLHQHDRAYLCAW